MRCHIAGLVCTVRPRLLSFLPHLPLHLLNHIPHLESLALCSSSLFLRTASIFPASYLCSWCPLYPTWPFANQSILCSRSRSYETSLLETSVMPPDRENHFPSEVPNNHPSVNVCHMSTVVFCVCRWLSSMHTRAGSFKARRHVHVSIAAHRKFGHFFYSLFD